MRGTMQPVMDFVPHRARSRDAEELRRLPAALALLRIGALLALAAGLWLLLR